MNVRRRRRRDRLDLIGEENRGLQCMFTMMNQARLAVGLRGRRHRGARLSAGAGLRAGAQAGPRDRQRRDTASDPIIEHPDVQAHAAADAGADRGGARRSAMSTAVALDIASTRQRPKVTRARADARAALLTPIAKAFSHRHRQRGRLARRADPWRHGLHRGNRRRAAFSRRPHRRRSTRAPTASSAIDLVTRKLGAKWRRFGVGAARRTTRDRQRTSKPRTIRRSAPPAHGCARRSTRWSAASNWLLEQAGRRRRTTRSPVRRRICGCSARRSAAALLAARGAGGARSRAMAMPSATSRWRGSSPRTSRCRPARWSAAWSTALRCSGAALTLLRYNCKSSIRPNSPTAQ